MRREEATPFHHILCTSIDPTDNSRTTFKQRIIAFEGGRVRGRGEKNQLAKEHDNNKKSSLKKWGVRKPLWRRRRKGLFRQSLLSSLRLSFFFCRRSLFSFLSSLSLFSSFLKLVPEMPMLTHTQCSRKRELVPRAQRTFFTLRPTFCGGFLGSFAFFSFFLSGGAVQCEEQATLCRHPAVATLKKFLYSDPARSPPHLALPDQSGSVSTP